MAIEKQRRAFISYSRVNKDFALKLAKELRSSGFNIWFDQLDIPTGARWDDEIEQALNDCEIFMVILTPASSTSDNVKDEIGYAIDSNKRILPVLLENANVPLRLRRFQYVDFTSKSFDEGVESAKQLLRNLIDEPTIPRESVTGSEVTEAVRKMKEDVPFAPAPASIAKPVEKKVATEEKPKKRTSSGLVIGIIVVVLLIAAGVGVISFGKGSSAAPTQIPTNVPAKVQPTVTKQPTKAPTQPPTATKKPTQVPTQPPAATATREPTLVPTADIDSLIKSAKILVYEDTAAEGLWIEPMMKSVGYADNAKFVHDRIGDLKTALTDDSYNWDLVIIAAESHSAVSGEFWDYVNTRLNSGAALIVETWTIHRQGEGRIKSILDGCGVKFQTNMDVAVPLKWYVPNNEIFTQPNQVADLSKTNRYWSGEAGDFMKLGTGSNAKILAGTGNNPDDSGLIISCYGGRMILQTFSNHDYPKAQITALWQNYIYNTLKNHFSQ